MSGLDRICLYTIGASDGFGVVFQARKALLEQLGRVLSPADEILPESVVLVNNNEWQGQVCQQNKASGLDTNKSWWCVD